MTVDDFITKWNGKYIDFDGVYGAQCMDLMHQYCVEVLGISDGSVLSAPSAQEVYTNFANVNGHDLFEQIGNTPTGVPQEGDIIFWTNLPYGHVAIFHDGDQNSFKSFDQNYPNNSPCHIQAHLNYDNVGGWLRYKGQSTPNNDQILIEQLRADRDKNWTLYQNEQTAKIQLEDVVNAKQTTIDNMTKDNLSLKATIDELTKEKQAALDDYTASQQETSKAKAEAQSCQVELAVANGLLANRKSLYTWSWKERFYSLFNKGG